MVKEKLLNSNFLAVLGGNFLLFFAFFTLLPVLPIYMQNEFNASHTEIGVVLSLYTITALIVRPFAGFLIDTLPRHPMQMLFYAAFTLLFCMYLLPGGIVLFAVTRALHGFVFGVITVANSTVAIDVLAPTRRNEGIGYYGISNNLGMALGPTISFTVLHVFGSYNALFLCAFAACVIGFILVSTVKMPDRHREAKAKPKERMPVSLDRFFLLKGKRESLTLALLSFSYGILSTYLAVYARDEVGIDESTGGFFMLMAAGLIGARITTGKPLRNGLLIKLITCGILLLFVGYGMFIFIKVPVAFFASAFVLGYSYGMICPPMQTMFINLARHDQRGTANSTYLTSWDVGVGLGVVIGGAIADVESYTAAYIFAVVLVAAGLVFFRKVTAPHFSANKLR
ncbi:MAG: MFS transporter [Bacteroidetes bacterium]|uniref:MFS transporter n=1 Tax=Candidatus Caccoplasma merdipullorum TaxID=2840718 RepID=A0A9D9E5V9_9BACT|nr:MFS transporter [Candidatus Caccoplasma merdipullorum]